MYVHGRSRKGLPVLWEQIGKVNLPRAEELGLPLSEILPNYVFLNECIWRVILDKGENDNDDAKVRRNLSSIIPFVPRRKRGNTEREELREIMRRATPTLFPTKRNRFRR